MLEGVKVDSTVNKDSLEVLMACFTGSKADLVYEGLK